MQEEKDQQNQKVKIAAQKKRAVKDVIDDTIASYGHLSQPVINKIRITMMDIVKNEELSEDEIASKTKKLIEVYSGINQ